MSRVLAALVASPSAAVRGASVSSEDCKRSTCVRSSLTGMASSSVASCPRRAADHGHQHAGSPNTAPRGGERVPIPVATGRVGPHIGLGPELVGQLCEFHLQAAETLHWRFLGGLVTAQELQHRHVAQRRQATCAICRLPPRTASGRPERHKQVSISLASQAPGADKR